jgi:hypothetical protein
MVEIDQNYLASLLSDNVLMFELTKRLCGAPTQETTAKAKNGRKIKRYLALEERNAVLAAIKRGEHYMILARRFNVSSTTISRLALQAGVRKRTKKVRP